jgi:hypothetical protein
MEDKTLNEIDEAVAEVDDKPVMNDEKLKELVDETISTVRNQAMILGYRVACHTIMDIIAPWRQKGCSHREYERIFKRVEEFCGKALNQPEKSVEETAQN